ncbi:hypothetical protein HU985_13270 [Photobacterium damselae subsp. damselae]|uniref:hypothetical protein n=1 Tax=Photobacterium damselae TaxID=38293 RepID=UPI001594C1D9|nr:hypothetical protein [Photobacterium damselae]NVH51866.1 hypothetical protein [Photobacterium damselae subsp. damselae]NVO82744.1 hypothetical protein [Photobacterium damselae subsp. damselae]
MEEMMLSGDFYKRINVRLEAKLDNHFDAAKHMLLKLEDNQLESFIKSYLNSSSSYKAMRAEMPSQTPILLSQYQRIFKGVDLQKVSKLVDYYGKKLTNGQHLFHGGLWPASENHSFITSRVFSTSFCPQIALRNAEWCGKAYDAGEVNLFVLRVVNSKTKAFCFRQNGTNKGHELEILFSAGATLTLRSKTFIREAKVYKSCRHDYGRVLEKNVPFYVLEVDIS